MSNSIVRMLSGTPVLVLFACSTTPPPPKAPVAVAGTADTRHDLTSPTQAQLRIAEDIRRACGIPESDAHFAFDSANVQPADLRVLSTLADCFVSGPLAGREMRLVGHADPRGDEEYNFVLGGRRADNVKTVLAQAGLQSDRMTSSSRGELEARGHDEASFREDRRVDVLLAH